jgi:hypothetical protein
MTAASKAKRSTMAVQSCGSVNVLVHPPKLSSEVMATLIDLACSYKNTAGHDTTMIRTRTDTAEGAEDGRAAGR